MLSDLPDKIIAFNFNIYEGINNTYDIQLIGSDEFDEEDEDWACSTYFTTGEDICYIDRTDNIKDWENGLEYIINLVKQYIEIGDYASILRNALVTSVGFVDGDLIIVHRKN